jgi:hypothetical protein
VDGLDELGHIRLYYGYVIDKDLGDGNNYVISKDDDDYTGADWQNDTPKKKTTNNAGGPRPKLKTAYTVVKDFLPRLRGGQQNRNLDDQKTEKATLEKDYNSAPSGSNEEKDYKKKAYKR